MKMRSSPVISKYFPVYRTCRIARESAFTLVEMLVVLAITGILSSLLMASFSSILGGGFNQTVSDMSETMEQARSYAMANNTYVYVGIQEVDANSTATPATAGSGLVVVGVVASKDGTDGFNGSTTWSGNSDLVAISKLRLFRSVHLSGSELPATGNMSRPVSANGLDYFVGSSSLTSTTTFSWPLSSASPTYTFTKVIRFGPQGDANILQSTATPTVDWIELDLQPIHGDVATSASATNVSAIQIDGMTGTVRSYRP
jgi:prepilin-type N-terminal cleavage/methylation domain-containing protein